LRTHRTPVELVADFRLDGGSIPSVREARVLLESRPVLQQQAEEAFDRFMRTQLPWALLAGTAAGGLAFGVRPGGGKRLLEGLAVGALCSVVVAGLFGGLTVATLDRTPAVHYEGLAASAPAVLRVVRTIAQESEDGWEAADAFVRGMSRVAGQLQQASGGNGNGETIRLLVASDMHDNLIGATLLSTLARSELNPVSAVILAGDLTQRGTAAEATLLITRLRLDGVPVLSVGGNHEDRPAMEVFGEAGHLLLAGRTVNVRGLQVRGEDDPLAWSFRTTPDPDLRAQAGMELLDSLQRGPMPDLLVVHDLEQARDTIDWAKEEDLALNVVYGHDHVATVVSEGKVNLVGAGTSGAAGYIGVGRDQGDLYTFQLLDFSVGPEPRLVSVTTLKYAGLAGEAVAEYFPIPE
jgi:predicted phosphodiesterase